MSNFFNQVHTLYKNSTQHQMDRELYRIKNLIMNNGVSGTVECDINYEETISNLTTEGFVVAKHKDDGKCHYKSHIVSWKILPNGIKINKN